MSSTPISKNEVEEIDQESEQALLLEEAYQLGYYKVKDGCLLKPLSKLNLLLERRETEARIDELTWFDDLLIDLDAPHTSVKVEDRITELKASLNQGGEDK